jgi:phosphoribosylformylglycinamidine synthase
MTRYPVLVEVTLREGIADPQGSTIERALPTLGFASVREVRVGKAFRFEVEAAGPDDARQQAEALASRLLSNPVLEDSAVTIGSETAGSETAGSETGRSKTGGAPA